jgi:AraC family transcriptional regulator, 4-hydroxyphenylacetate 3-monooxygenase operon regulatory protein
MISQAKKFFFQNISLKNIEHFMTFCVPIFTNQGAVYQSDACQPLVQAAKAGEIRLEALARGQYPGRRLGRCELPAVRNMGFWDASGEQNWGLDWHRNEGIELTYLETGSLTFSVGDKEYLLSPGDIAITRPWQPHKIGHPNVGPSRLHWVILDVGIRRPNQVWKWPSWLVLTSADIQDLTAMLSHNEQPVWRAAPEIGRRFQKLGVAVKAQGETNHLSRIVVGLNELFLLLLEMLRQRDVVLTPFLSSARRTVELFLGELRDCQRNLQQPWTIENMARQCGLGVTSFVQYCKQLTNMTPFQFLNRCRVEAAKKLLRENPAMNITEIAAACGFDSSQYFATVFRKNAGFSPKDFRKKNRSLHDSINEGINHQ